MGLSSRLARDCPLLSRRAQEVFAFIEAIVLEEGFARLTIGELAERLECSKRTIYELAPSKNELVMRILSAFFSGIRDDAARAIALEADPSRRIYVYLQAGVHAATNLSSRAVADIDRWEPARSIWQQHLDLRVQGLRELLENGIAHGAFRDVNPQFVAEIVFAGLNRLRQPDFYTRTGVSASSAFQEYYRILLTGLLAEHQHPACSDVTGPSAQEVLNNGQ